MVALRSKGSSAIRTMLVLRGTSILWSGGLTDIIVGGVVSGGGGGCGPPPGVHWPLPCPGMPKTRLTLNLTNILLRSPLSKILLSPSLLKLKLTSSLSKILFKSFRRMTTAPQPGGMLILSKFSK